MKIAALDIGGTAIKQAIWNGTNLLMVSSHPSKALQGGEALIEQVKSILGNMQPFDAIGISTSGEVNPHSGVICSANKNIPFYAGKNLVEILQAHFSVPVAIENDANAAALGELHYGSMQNESDFLFVSYGTGVGGAIIVDGKLYSGNAFSAGSFGGMVVHPEFLSEQDLLAGRYETYASTSALVRRAIQIDPYLNSGRAVFSVQDNPLVQAEISNWIQEIVIGLVTLIYAFSPRSVVLGGGIMEHTNLVKTIENKVKEFVEPRFENVRIVQAQLGNSAGIMGVVYLAQEKQLSNREKS